MAGAAAAGFFAQDFEAAAGGSCHGVFRIAVSEYYRGERGSMRTGHWGSLDPIGIAQEKHKRRSRLTPRAMLALY
jgi:hypothetical protein